MMDTMLRAATWLSPGLPLGLFSTVTAAIASALETEFTLESFTETSGPALDDNPFAGDAMDLGFICGPSCRALLAEAPPTVRLVGAAPVFMDQRNEGRPTYFAVLVARAALEASSLADLHGARIGFNDEQSLSGFTAMRDRLEELGLGEPFATFVHTGGHHQSLRALANGQIDAASVDSNTLLSVGQLPADVRVIETLGPFPVQPVVVRSSLADKTRDVITRTLLSLHEDPDTARRLRQHRVERFAPVTEDDYR